MNNPKLDSFCPKNEMEKTVWNYITGRDTFTYAELAAELPISRYTTRTFIRKLRESRHIRVAHTKGPQIFFTAKSVINKIGNQAQQRSTPEGAIWSAIRILGSYSASDVVCSLSGTNLSITLPQVRTYMQRLLQADYLHVVRRATPDSGREAIYRLINDTGPLPPVIKRKRVVIDQNEDRVVFVEGVK